MKIIKTKTMKRPINFDSEIHGTILNKHNNPPKEILDLIGQVKENWDIIKKYKLKNLYLGNGDKVDYYANEQLNICLRFEEDFINEDYASKLTDIYQYPDYYEKSAEEINNEMIAAAAIVLGIKKQFEVLHTGEKIDHDDLLIDAYLHLKNNKQLK